jgi:hypothetical protein
MQAIREVGMMAKTQPGSQLEALARLPGGKFEDPNDPIRELTGSVLVKERRKKGDSAARQLAEIYSSLPTLWK